MDSDIQQGPLTTPSTAAVAPQIRSRITVVCAECKRLKLKCDRRNPCGSCQKRDTVSRCIYSPAAAEKVDLHSLNNRLIQVEATLAQLTSGQFMPSYPFSAPSNSSNGPPPPSLSLNVTLTPPTIQHSSLAIPLEEIGGTWLNDIDLGIPLPTDFSSKPSQDNSGADVKVEPRTLDSFSLSADLDDIDMADRPSTSPSTTISSPNLASLSISSSNTHAQLPPTSMYYLSSSNKPQLTAALISLLPSLNNYSSSQPSLRSVLTSAEELAAYSYPFLNWKTLRERGLEMVMNARNDASSPAANVMDKEMVREKEREREREKRERESAQARQVFMGSSRRPVFGASDVNMQDVPSQPTRSHYRPELFEDQSGRPSSSSRPTASIPFFAALCAAIALGTLEAGRKIAKEDDRSGRLRSRSIPFFDSRFWYSLSVQAIGVWDAAVAVTSVSADPEHLENEKESKRTKEDLQHEMDYITACLLQLTFLAKGGLRSGTGDDAAKGSPGLARDKKSAKGVAAVMFPLVGKVVNYARQMLLNKDPEDMGLVQMSDAGSPNGSTSSGGLPSGAKKAKSNSNNKLSDPSVLANLSTSRTSSEPRFSLYDTEIRRRAWWAIMYYDLFVSDIMNQPPLIADSSFNTKRPVANVDENVFGPTSIRIPAPENGGEDGSGYCKDGMRYFEIRSRLTLLVRSIKRRMNTPEFGHAPQVRTSYYGSSPNSHCYSIDQAASMEAEVRAWLNDLPIYFHLDYDGESDPVLVAQRSEIAMTAHRLVLRVYLPFLKKHAAGVPHQANLGSINAAHGIMQAAKALSDLWKTQEGGSNSPSLSPALFDFYPFPRGLFDAAVVCAHAVIKQPSTMWAAAAMEDVDTALDIMKGLPDSKFGSAAGAKYVISSGDCIQIIEALKQKAEGGSSSRRGASPNVPLKRKHSELDESNHVPQPPPPPSTTTPSYVYPTIPAPTPVPVPSQEPILAVSNSAPPPSAPVVQPPKRQPPFPAANGADKAKHESNASPKGNEKDKKQKKAYPAVGVRKRPAKDSSPLAQSPATQSPTSASPRSRRQSVSVVTSTTPTMDKSTSVRLMHQSPLSQSQPSPASQHPPFQSPTISQLQAAQEQLAHRSRSSSLTQDPRLHVQRARRDSVMSTSTDYSMGNYAPSEDPSMDMPPSTSSPQTASPPEMLRSAISISTGHNLQQTYVESPASYDASPETPYDFSFDQQQAAVEGFGPTRVNTFDSYSSSSSSPFGNAGTSNGAAGSPYTTTPTFGVQPHQPSPPSFSQKHNPASQPQEYYSNSVLFEGYDTAGAGGPPPPPGMVHGELVQNVISGVMDDPMIFDHPVSYDVKPSMDELNEQHRQQQQQRQQAYQPFNPHPHSDPHSHPQVNHGVSPPHVWGTGHIPDGQYWGDPTIAVAADNQYFQT